MSEAHTPDPFYQQINLAGLAGSTQTATAGRVGVGVYFLDIPDLSPGGNGVFSAW